MSQYKYFKSGII